MSAKKATQPKVDIDKTRNKLERVGLLHAREQLDELIAAAVKADGGPHRFLDELLETELTWREERRLRTQIDEFTLLDGRRVFLLGEGRLVNLAAAEGQPAGVMDMSFSNQALAVELLALRKDDEALEAGVHPLPEALDLEVAALKLETMGMSIESLTPEQEKYLEGWEEGT